jgi:protoporphyrinogen/coproporphyrinogen III oxidase
MDLFIPSKHDGEDETIAEFIRRRLGSEALDKIAEPLMSGIYNAEAEKQSLLATFPRFRALEVEHGSLIRGMVAARKAHSAPNGSAPPSKTTSMFISLIGGTKELVDTLVQRLRADARVKMLENARIEQISRRPEGGYQLTLGDGGSLDADAIIVTTPAYTAADLVGMLAPDAAESLAQIRYVSTGTISLTYRRDEIQHPLDGFGLVIPRSEHRAINAITWTSTKFDHRAPAGYVLMRTFFGGSRHPEMMAKSDDELQQTIYSELDALMGITASPVFHRIYRWHNANPQYDKGHLQQVDTIEAALPVGLYVTGSAYRGIGIPDCVHQAQQTAVKVINHLNEMVPA